MNSNNWEVHSASQVAREASWDGIHCKMNTSSRIRGTGVSLKTRDALSASLQTWDALRESHVSWDAYVRNCRTLEGCNFLTAASLGACNRPLESSQKMLSNGMLLVPNTAPQPKLCMIEDRIRKSSFLCISYFSGCSTILVWTIYSCFGIKLKHYDEVLCAKKRGRDCCLGLEKCKKWFEVTGLRKLEINLAYLPAY